MTIVERALELVPNGSRIGLGSGRAPQAFVVALGERLRKGSFIEPIPNAPRLEMDIRALPGVVGTGLFLRMAETVLVGDRDTFQLLEERRRGPR